LTMPARGKRKKKKRKEFHRLEKIGGCRGGGPFPKEKKRGQKRWCHHMKHSRRHICPRKAEQKRLRKKEKKEKESWPRLVVVEGKGPINPRERGRSTLYLSRQKEKGSKKQDRDQKLIRRPF